MKDWFLTRLIAKLPAAIPRSRMKVRTVRREKRSICEEVVIS
jgi:hypothetical protein